MNEEKRKEELKIPVMHDDQHGTAIISSVALLGALELAEKIEKVKHRFHGAGAAAISCAKTLPRIRRTKKNILMRQQRNY